MATFTDARLRSLQTARECVELGARQRTIAWVTGLSPTFILRSVYDGQHPAPRGRPPYTEEFVFRAPLRVQAEVGIFALRYRALRTAGFAPARSLITAYRHYRSVVRVPLFCFDEAFFLVSNLDGIWAATAPAIDLGECRGCGSTHVLPRGSAPGTECPVCKVARAHAASARGHSSPGPGPVFVSQTVSGAPIAIDGRIRSLKFRQSLHALGAHQRVIAVLSACHEHRGRAIDGPVRVGRPLPLSRWRTAVQPVQRMQYSIVAMTHRRLVSAGFAAEEALRTAFEHARSVVLPMEPLSFNRCFEAISLLDARWGVAAPGLELVACPACESWHLISLHEAEPTPCPFCIPELAADTARA
jgi:flagellar transcriptional activator FlhC